MAMDAEEKELRRASRQWWKVLDEARQEQFNNLAADLNWSKSRAESEKTRVYMFVEELGENFSDVLARQRSYAAKRKADEEEREQQRLDKALAYQEKERLALKALSRGEPIPSGYRPAGGICICCKRYLKDPVSIRWGIGPDCMASLKLFGGIVTPGMEQAKRLYKAEYQDQKNKALPIPS